MTMEIPSYHRNFYYSTIDKKYYAVDEINVGTIRYYELSGVLIFLCEKFEYPHIKDDDKRYIKYDEMHIFGKNIDIMRDQKILEIILNGLF